MSRKGVFSLKKAENLHSRSNSTHMKYLKHKILEEVRMEKQCQCEVEPAKDEPVKDEPGKADSGVVAPAVRASPGKGEVEDAKAIANLKKKERKLVAEKAVGDGSGDDVEKERPVEAEEDKSSAEFARRASCLPSHAGAISREDFPQANYEVSESVSLIAEDVVQANKDIIKWIQVGCGQLAARPVPSAKQLASWNATVLVTLFENPSPKLKQMVELFGLRWLVAGVAAISDVGKALSDKDVESFRQVDLVLQLLRDGERVAVHCQAGMHRTGCFIYVLLRRSGLSSQEALEALRQTREITWDEMTVVAKRRPEGLWVKAEDIFQMLFGDGGSWSRIATTPAASAIALAASPQDSPFAKVRVAKVQVAAPAKMTKAEARRVLHEQGKV